MEISANACQELFLQAYNKSLSINLERLNTGVGTLKEKTLHIVLKNYFEPNSDFQEIKVGRYIADICHDNEIIEIQTGNVGTLLKKLEYFLDSYNVTVVYPVICEKNILWVDTQTGETTKKRKSPKKGKPTDILGQLYNLKHLLLNGNLQFCIAMIKADEYKYLDGYSKDKKRGSSRIDRIPTGLEEEIYLKDREDYMAILPNSLPEKFTVKEFKKALGISPRQTSSAINVLCYLQILEKCGNRGRAYLYRKIE